MASRFLSLLVVSFSLLLHDVVDSLDPPQATVLCTENGFSPLFVQPWEQGKVVVFDVTVGGGGEGCSSRKTISDDDEDTRRVERKDLNTDKSDREIPFREGDPACGGEFVYNEVTQATIDYSVLVTIVVTETFRKAIKRVMKYEFNLRCHLKREADISSAGKGGSFRVSNQDMTSLTHGDVTDSFTLSASLKLSNDHYPEDDRVPEFELSNTDDLYIRIAEDRPNPFFKFIVNRCWVTPDSDPNYYIKDIFFEAGCPVDETVNFTRPSMGQVLSDKFNIKMRAFFFAAEPGGEIHVHCNIYICDTSDYWDYQCVQPNEQECLQRQQVEAPYYYDYKRRKRSVNNNNNSNNNNNNNATVQEDTMKRTGNTKRNVTVQEKTISSNQHFVYDNPDLYIPECGEGHVYNRRRRTCTNDNLLQIKGVHLSTPWNPQYKYPHSPTFVKLAREKAYQLHSLLQTVGRRRVINGVKVVRVEKVDESSIVLDVVVNYAGYSNSANAASEFEEALRTTRKMGLRVLKILNVHKERSIEYIPVTGEITSSESMTSLSYMLIVVGGLLLALTSYAVGRFHQQRLEKVRYAKANAFLANEWPERM